MSDPKCVTCGHTKESHIRDDGGCGFCPCGVYEPMPEGALPTAIPFHLQETIGAPPALRDGDGGVAPVNHVAFTHEVTSVEKAQCPVCGRDDIPLKGGRMLRHSMSMKGESVICVGGGKTVEGASSGAAEETPTVAYAPAMGESVDHPAHYNLHPSGVECIDIIEVMTFNVGSAMKYLWRAGLKGSAPKLEDLKKSAWYIAREIEKVEKEERLSNAGNGQR